jgi:tRNA-dihydrouridine synthase
MSGPNIWQTLLDRSKATGRPILALAPMEDVTDTVFRRVILSCGRPDVMFTEFTSSEGICSPGQARVIHRLQYTPEEKPLIAQIWGVTPEDYLVASQLIVDMGFDGIDINMGCPVKKIIKQGACSALINNHKLAAEVIQATKAGANHRGKNLPVSIKTRLGFNHIQTEEWLGFILSQKPAALTVHGRTVKEMSKVPVHWEEMAKIHQLRQSISPDTVLLGNGDINSYQEALDKSSEYKLDGVMIGRGVLHNPWIFNPQLTVANITLEQRLRLFQLHLRLWDETWTGENLSKSFNLMKKYFKVYIQNFKGASDLRDKLMRTNSATEALHTLQTFYQNFDNFEFLKQV